MQKRIQVLGWAALSKDEENAWDDKKCEHNLPSLDPTVDSAAASA